MRNRLKCNDKKFLKDKINAKNAWKILKNSFSSFESEVLKNLLQALNHHSRQQLKRHELRSTIQNDNAEHSKNDYQNVDQ
jgi:hypothetical protein